MAKNTLSFEEMKLGGTLTLSDTAIVDSDTLWYDDEVTLYDGDTITITSFDGIGEVHLIGSNVDETLDTDTSSYTHDTDSVSGDTFKIALKNEDKGKIVHYEIERATVGAGYSSNPEPNEVEDADGETTYKADSTSYATHIQLAAGDTIKSVNVPSAGGSPLLYFVGDTPRYHTIIESWSDGFTSDVDEEIIIVFFSHYEESTGAYKIINRGASECDTLVSGTNVYKSTTGFELRSGDEITLLTDDVDVDLINEADSVAATLSGEGDSYVATEHNNGTFYLAAKSSGIDEVEYEILPDVSRRKYAAEYEGGSGIMQLRHAIGAKVDVLGDAGAGYMLIHKMEGRELVRAVNMDGFNKMKFVSDGQIDECIINEF